MKKRMRLVAALFVAAVAMTACGDKNSVKPDEYVTLGEYKEIPVTVAAVSVSEEQITDYINSALQGAAVDIEVTGRPVADGDTVNIDFLGKKDGVAFDGGASGEGGYDLVIGSNSFIEGFEAGLVGANVGDTLDLELTFPEEYGNEELNGQPVVFTVTVNKILEKQVPELTDEVVATLQAECKTVDEYKAYVKETLTTEAQEAYESEIQMKAFEYVSGAATVGEPPAEMVQKYVDQSLEMVETYASYYQMTADEFISESLQTTKEEFETTARETAVETSKENLIIRAIAKKENIKVADKEITDFAEEQKDMLGLEKAEEYLAEVGKEEVEIYLLSEKVMEALRNYAVVIEE